MQDKVTPNVGKKGMKRNVSPHLLGEGEYVFALNSNNESVIGDRLNPMWEPSNLLSITWPTGFKVIGYKNDTNSNSTYFFLTNPTTGFSKFGYVSNTQNITSVEDVEAECDDCDYKNLLSTPLEEQTQTPSQTFIELLNDDCNGEFNFNINFPLKKIEIKNEKCGKVIYFTDNYNPFRSINLSKLDQYTTTGTDVCGEDNTEETCLNPDKLLVFPKYSSPTITPSEIVLGGELPLGTYEFLIAYSDNLGNELTEYKSLTNPISIFDENNTILEQGELSSRTNFAIKLDVSNLDPNFEYYKVAVIQRSNIQNAERYFVEGIHPITDTSVLYTGDRGKQELSLNNLFFVKPNVTKVKGITQSNKSLILNGITAEKEWNLQPVVNLLGSFLRWQTHITTEDYYKNGVNTSLGKGYHRDEVQPFGIRFGSTTGYETAIFPLINRPATSAELAPVAVNDDSNSIQNNVNACSSSIRTAHWQYYNTATEEGDCSLVDIPTNTITEPVTKICTIENVVTAPSASFTTDEVDDFSTLENFVNDNFDCSSEYPFCEYLDPSLYDDCAPTFTDCDTPVLEDEYLRVNTITGTTIVENPQEFPEDYRKLVTSGFCDIYRRDSNGNYVRDEEFEDDYFSGVTIGGFVSLYMYERMYFFTNDRPTSAEVLEFVIDPTQPLSFNYFHNYLGGEATIDSVQDTDFDVTCTATNSTIAGIDLQFSSKVHLNSLWFEVETKDREQYIFEITDHNATSSNSRDLTRIHSRNRLSVFPSKRSGTSIFCKIFQVFDGGQQLLITQNETNGYITFKESDTDTGVKFTEISLSGSSGSTNINVNGTNYLATFDTNLVTTASNFVSSHSAAILVDSGAVVISDGSKIHVIDNSGVLPNITTSNVSGNLQGNLTLPRSLFFAVEPPITNDTTGNNAGDYAVFPTASCFGVAIREIEIESYTISYDSITFDKVQKYIADCDFEIPIISECNLQPYKYGKFAYNESTEDYPDNEELYNSSNLVISQSDIPVEHRDEFEENYVDSIVEGNYILNENTDFRCTPIRHYKFPDNSISPFMWQNEQAPFTPDIIFPLGITIDEELINSFLDIAVTNGLITQEQRDSITYYEIFKGDRSLDKSIIAKGLLYDMYEYEENGKTIKYSNYPYNDLGDDVLHYDDSSRTDFIDHPYGGTENNSWTFHSPESDYYRPTLPTEMKVEGYMFGASRGVFNEVESHPKWVILGSDAYRLASNLATAEVVAEAAIAIAESAEVYRFYAGFVVSANPVGIGLNIAVAATQILSSVLFKYGRYKYQWLESFRNLGQPKNFAYYYTSVGHYNYFKTIQTAGNSLRALNISKYLKEGKFYFTDETEGEKIEINNINRERSVYLGISNSYPLNYPSEYINYDNANQDRNLSSRTYLSEVGQCVEGRSDELVKRIASPYVSIKNYIPSQFGTIDSVKWLTTSYKGDLTNPQTDCLPIFGGDVFITRHTLKRKYSMFLTDAMDVPSLTPFNYKFYSTVGREPRFYVNYEVTDDVNLDRGFPELKSEYNLDCLTGDRSFYVKEPSKFYLYYYGIPSFLCETEINTNYRYGKKEPENNFYPNVEDYVDWTQEKNVSIRQPNTYFYNSVYSDKVNKSVHRILPSSYNREDYDCRYDSRNGGLISMPDNSENDLIDPWLIYRPLDKYELDSSKGELIDFVRMPNEQLLGRFENGMALYNAFTELVDDGQRPETQNLGGTMFLRRAVDYTSTELGDKGTQHAEYVSTPYGTFSVDAKRGKIHRVTGAEMPEEISSFINGEESGMRNWFREHLPFKILKDFPTLNTDNKFKSIGISIGFDSRFDRVFFTKKDYRLKTGLENNFEVNDGVLFIDGVEADFTNTTYFEDASWTISYKPIEGAWTSYYSFKPDYYIGHNNYFQTGVNYNEDSSELGLWSHLLTNKSFGVFYGKKYPFILEIPFKNEYTDKLVKSLEFTTEAKRYHNEYDFSVDRYMTFNKAILYNNTNNSGKLNLIPQKNNLLNAAKYPITNNDNTQDVLVTSQDGTWNLNYFYNRVKNDTNNLSIFLKDINDIDKTINDKAVSFKGKNPLERFRGDWSILRLEFDKDSRYSLMYSFALSEEQLY